MQVDFQRETKYNETKTDNMMQDASFTGALIAASFPWQSVNKIYETRAQT